MIFRSEIILPGGRTYPFDNRDHLLISSKDTGAKHAFQPF